LLGVKEESRTVEVTDSSVLTALRSFRHMPWITNGLSHWSFVSTRIRFTIFAFIDLRESVAITEIDCYFVKNLFLFISVDSFCRLSVQSDCFSALFHFRVIMLTCSVVSIWRLLLEEHFEWAL
jgi:hypothetical protein